MIDDSLSYYYLEQLDIQLWHERDKPSCLGSEIQFIIHDLLTVQNQTIGYLAIFPSLNTEEQESLLNAMMVAIQLKVGGIHRKSSLTGLKKPLLTMFGSDEYSPESLSTELNLQVVQTHHPRKLIDNPLLKRQAWKDLKRYQGTWMK